MKDAVVIGSGVSGIVAAYTLKKAGFDPLVIEKEPHIGGSTHTLREDGRIIELGVQSVLGQEEFMAFAKELNLKPLHPPKEHANTRYVYLNGQLKKMPSNPIEFLTSDFFSIFGKIRLLREPFIPPKDDPKESISDFVTRRLGKEFLDKIVEPFVCGIYAGDPDKLSAKYAVRRVKALEDEYGSIIKGSMKKKALGPQGEITSFEGGLLTFLEKMASGIDISLENVALKITKKDDIYTIDTKSGKIQTKSILIATPAYSASYLLRNLTWSMSAELDQIEYAPVIVISAIVKHPLPKGFGFLIPRKENTIMLGALFSSNLFKICKEDENIITIYVGGERRKDVADWPEEKIISQVKKELKQILGIEDFEKYYFKKWKKAIPQYNIGYERFINTVKDIENMNKGVFIAGNYIEGNSFNDSLRYAMKKANEQILFLKKGVAYAQV